MFKKHILHRSGFTLAEIMIVVALLGALLIGLMAAIDPLEQLKKGVDVNRKKTANDIYEALMRIGDVGGKYPWSSDLTAVSMSSVTGTSVIQSLIQSGELQANFADHVKQDLSSIYLTASEDGKTMFICYIPESKAFKTNAKYCTDTACYDCLGNINMEAAGFHAPVTQTESDQRTFDLSLLSPTASGSGLTTPTPIPAPDTPITRSVMVIDFNPMINNHNEKLRDVEGWNNPVTLEAQFINAVKIASGGFINYSILSRQANINAFPPKDDDFQYTEQSYLDVISGITQAHQPDIPVNYQKIFTDYNICDKVNSGQIQEIWFWGGPWFGFWPTATAGTYGTYTGAPPVDVDGCTKPVVLMGFRYDQDVTAMMAVFASRAENALSYYFGETNSASSVPSTDWGKFSEIDLWSPGNASCGMASHAINADNDQDFANTKTVSSTCDGWRTYPNITTSKQSVSCTAWGCTQKGYYQWWFSHIPAVTGITNEMENNWWRYVLYME